MGNPPRFGRITYKNQRSRRDWKDRRRRRRVAYSWPRLEIGAAWLKEVGFRPGDRVRIVSPRRHVIIITNATPPIERLWREIGEAAEIKLKIERGEKDLRDKPERRLTSAGSLPASSRRAPPKSPL